MEMDIHDNVVPYGNNYIMILTEFGSSPELFIACRKIIGYYTLKKNNIPSLWLDKFCVSLLIESNRCFKGVCMCIRSVYTCTH